MANDEVPDLKHQIEQQQKQIQARVYTSALRPQRGMRTDLRRFVRAIKDYKLQITNDERQTRGLPRQKPAIVICNLSF